MTTVILIQHFSTDLFPFSRSPQVVCENCADMRTELEQLRKWHADYEIQQDVLRENAAREVMEISDVKDMKTALEEKVTEVANLKVKMLDMEKAFNRVVTEKAKLDMILVGDDRWGKATLSEEAMGKAEKMIKQCGKFGGKMVVKPNMEVWKGYACSATDEEMNQYMDYEPRGMCPNDWLFVQHLIYDKNCFSLPKRRCSNRTPEKLVEPLPLPDALFDQASLVDESVRWDQHNCKSFECLNTRLVGDCRNCFNLSQEFRRWKANYRGSVKIEEVIRMKKGTLRIGLDAGGGTGSFAAHMAKWNVTIMTTAFNLETVDGRSGGLPYMEAIALRGLVPLHIPHKARLPFFDNTLDIIHCVNSVKYLPMLEFEELIYEWDRVLRPGGIMWFEMFYAPIDEMPIYVGILDLLGYKRLYWNVTPKPDSAEHEGPHVYLNSVIEKTARGDGPLSTATSSSSSVSSSDSSS